MDEGYFRTTVVKVVLSVLSLCLYVIVERQIIDEIILMTIGKHRTSVSCFTPKILTPQLH